MNPDLPSRCPAWCVYAEKGKHPFEGGRRVHGRNLGQATRRLDATLEVNLVQVEQAAADAQLPPVVRVFYGSGPGRTRHMDLPPEAAAGLAWIADNLKPRELREFHAHLISAARLLGAST